MISLNGACHCGGVEVAFMTIVPPAEAQVLACQCSFCRMHGVLAVGDPKGTIEFVETRSGAMRRYRFALGTADYILCGNCGVYLGAVLSEETGEGYGIVNIRVLDEPGIFTQTPQPAVYDAENEAERIDRRRHRWTPLARS